MGRVSYQPELPFHHDSGESIATLWPTEILLPHINGESYLHVFEPVDLIRGRELDYAIILGQLSVLGNDYVHIEGLPDNDFPPKPQLNRQEVAAILKVSPEELPDLQWETSNVVAHVLNPWVKLQSIL